MTPIKPLLAAAAIAALPSLAFAESEVIVGGAVTTSVGTGSTSNTEFTAEVFAEFAANGFHAGIWMGSLYQDPSDDFEFELSVGYGGEAGAFGYDISAIAYYLNNSGFDHVGIGTSLSYGFTDALTGLFYAEVNTDTKDWDREIGLEYAFSDSLTGWVIGGKSDGDANNYGEIGVSYGLSDNAAIDLVYEDANDSDGTLSLTLSFETAVFGG